MWFAALGVPRAAGQMFGYLMACDPAEQSAGEISASTGMSPASVSSSARLLTPATGLSPNTGTVVRTTALEQHLAEALLAASTTG